MTRGWVFHLCVFLKQLELYAFHDDEGFKNPQAREEGEALTCPPPRERDTASSTNECAHKSPGLGCVGLDVVIISEGAESNGEGHGFKAPLRSGVFSACFPPQKGV